MNKGIWITAALIFLGFFLIKKFNTPENSTLLNFVLTLIATFVGVYLGIFFTDRYNENIKKEKALKILEQAYFEINGNGSYIQKLNVCFLNENCFFKDSLHKAYKNNLLSYPKSIVQLFEDNSLKEFYSNATLNQLSMHYNNINSKIEELEKSENTLSDDEFLRNINSIIWESQTFIIKQMDWEAQYLKGNITIETLQQNIVNNNNAITEFMKSRLQK